MLFSDTLMSIRDILAADEPRHPRRARFALRGSYMGRRAILGVIGSQARRKTGCPQRRSDGILQELHDHR